MLLSTVDRTDLDENVATTQAEYLAMGIEKAEKGFDTLNKATTHATDLLCVNNAYTGIDSASQRFWGRQCCNARARADVYTGRAGRAAKCREEHARMLVQVEPVPAMERQSQNRR